MNILTIEELNKRSITYRFDLERDVPWAQISSPGRYFSLSLLKQLGFDVDLLARHPDAMDICQWAMALAVAEAFAHLEYDVVTFASAEQAATTSSKRTVQLVDEERKHIDMFQRFCHKLRNDRPELVDAFDSAYRPPESFAVLQNLAERYSAEEFQWLFWLTTIFFEECTVYISHCLEKEKQTIQPAWLAAHRCHRREETQHILTDAANLEQLALGPDKRKQLATLFAGFLEKNITEFFSIGTWIRLQGQLYPDKEFRPAQLSLRASGIFHDFRHHPAFRFTRHYLPELLRESAVGSEKFASYLSAQQSAVKNPSGEDTLVDRFERAIRGDGAIVFRTTTTSESRISYHELFLKSKTILSALQTEGIAAQDSVIIWLNEPQKMLPVFWGCVLGGFIPIVLTPSIFIDDKQEQIERLWRVLQRTQFPVIIVDDAVKIRLADVLSKKGKHTIRIISVLELDGSGERIATLHRPAPDDVAMVQFSSGTMGAPRGAALSHRNLLAVIDAMLVARAGNPEDVFVNWLPLSHDMGLIGFHLTPLAIGATQIHIPTYEFVKRPTEWFRCLHEFKATVTAGTNSAIVRVLSTARVDFFQNLDLSHVHSFIVGAEPLSEDVMRELITACKSSGLRAQAICPAYGLAEAALAVTMTPLGEEPVIGHFSRSALNHGRASTAKTIEDTVALVELGTPLKAIRVRIVDEEFDVVQDNTVGSIQVAGPTVMTGYFNDKAATNQAIQNGWFNTGDKGFLNKERLYFVGRDQDAFVVRGQNFYASDVEKIAAQAITLAPDGAVLLVDSRSAHNDSQLVLFVVSKSEPGGDLHATLDTIFSQVQRRMGISLDLIIRIRRRDIPRTTSGKIAKAQLLARYRNGQFAQAASLRLPPSLRHWNRHDDQRESSTKPPAISVVEFWQNVVANIREIWADVLNMPVIEVTEDCNFRSLGGDSLKAAEVLVRLENVSGLSYPIELLVHGNTVREMAAFVTIEHDRQMNAPANDACQKADQSNIEKNVLFKPGTIDSRAQLPDIRQEESSTITPIAVIGIGLRFPGGQTQDEFWQLLSDGKDAFQVTPEQRRQGPVWNESIQKKTSSNETGAYLTGVEQFDPSPFNIPEEQVKYIDPQQRLFLEICLEALEQAPIVDRRIGVFVASGENEYAHRFLGDVDKIGRYSLLGGLRNMIAARVSQVFAFTGPALAVDTACSGSATAVHLACESLRNGECAMALAGGVQLNLSNQVYNYFGRAGLLSNTGKCRPFDQDAAGLVPGEGAGVVLLKPLNQAVIDGDRIVGIIRSSAINNDGGALSGTAPSTIGQRNAIETAYARAGISPSTISYIEAHAAGTAVGDAVEVRSVSEALADVTRSIPIGSVKSNIGHTLAAAGIASLIKVLLSLERKELPPTLGCHHPAERIGFNTTRLYPLTDRTPWQTEDRRIRRAGVNSFGLGGTNVHIVVDEAPSSQHESLKLTGRSIFCLCATTGQSARVSELYRQHIAQSDHSLEEICATSLMRGQLFTERQAFVVGSKHELARSLEKFASAGNQPNTTEGLVAFVCPGGGSDVVQATRYLLGREPKFNEIWKSCATHLATMGLDLEASLARSATTPHLLPISQALVFSFSVAASRWLAHLGVIPDMVIGHSVGEYAAAHIAGIITLENALSIIVERSMLMEKSAAGEMIVVFAPESEVKAALDKEGLHIDVAARNSPEQIVLSGPLSEIRAAAGVLSNNGIFTQTLPVKCGAHSSLMEPLQDKFASSCQDILFSSADVSFISSVEGTALTTTDADYWVRQLRAPVEFSSAVQYASSLGAQTIIELNGSASLSACVQAACAHNEVPMSYIPLVRSDAEGEVDILNGLSTMFNAGIRVQLGRTCLCQRAVSNALPPYPYVRQRHWIDLTTKPGPEQPHTYFDLKECAIRDHRIAGVATAPLAWIVDQVFKSLSHTTSEPQELGQLILEQGFSVHAGETRRLEVLYPSAGTSDSLLVRSEGVSLGESREHMRCEVRPLRTRVFSKIDLDSIAAHCPIDVSPDAVYELLSRHGLEIGPTMRSVQSVQMGDDELLVRLESPDGATVGHLVDPCLLDGAAHAVAAFFKRSTEKFSGLYVGFSVEAVRAFASVHDSAIAYVRLHRTMNNTAESLRYDIILASEHGDVLLVAKNFVARHITTINKPLNATKVPAQPTAQLPLADVETVVPDLKAGKNRCRHASMEGKSHFSESDRILILTLSRRIVARYLGVAPESIAQKRRFSELGVDSLMAVKIAQELENEIGISLHSALLFEANTLFDLCNLLSDKLQNDQGARPWLMQRQ